uniref:YTH domain-containing protein n=1 Tax=Meloidogyne hapla TaxID=6305 RepID=A0A1I8BFV8_MELHA
MLRISNGSVYVVLAGDKGGDKLANTSKFGFFISANLASNSYRNFSFLVCWKGDDGRKQQEFWLMPVLQQIDSIYEVSLGNGQIFKIKWFLCSDLKFLKDFLGHKGAASNYPCSLCRRSKHELVVAYALGYLEQWT